MNKHTALIYFHYLLTNLVKTACSFRSYLQGLFLGGVHNIIYLCLYFGSSTEGLRNQCAFFNLGGETERKINPANFLASHLEFHRLPSGCSLCNLSRHLQENHSKIISPHREGTTEAANLQTEARAWSQLLLPRTQNRT